MPIFSRSLEFLRKLSPKKTTRLQNTSIQYLQPQSSYSNCTSGGADAGSSPPGFVHLLSPSLSNVTRFFSETWYGSRTPWALKAEKNHVSLFLGMAIRNYILGLAPSQDSSDHQDYYISSRESL